MFIKRTVFRPFLPFSAALYISLFERVEFNTSCSYTQTAINYNNHYLTHASEECHVFHFFFIIIIYISLTSALHFFGSKCRIPQIRQNIFVSRR